MGERGPEIARRAQAGTATVKPQVAAAPAKTGTRDRIRTVVAAGEAGFLSVR